MSRPLIVLARIPDWQEERRRKVWRAPGEAVALVFVLAVAYAWLCMVSP